MTKSASFGLGLGLCIGFDEIPQAEWKIAVLTVMCHACAAFAMTRTVLGTCAVNGWVMWADWLVREWFHSVCHIRFLCGFTCSILTSRSGLIPPLGSSSQSSRSLLLRILNPSDSILYFAYLPQPFAERHPSLAERHPFLVELP